MGGYVLEDGSYIESMGGYVTEDVSYTVSMGGYVPEDGFYIWSMGGYVPEDGSYIGSMGGYLTATGSYSRQVAHKWARELLFQHGLNLKCVYHHRMHVSFGISLFADMVISEDLALHGSKTRGAKV